MRRKIGLALSGGAARGAAHIGVLQVLQEEGIPIDLIAGTSAGAVVGAAYARQRDISRLASGTIETNWKKMAPLIDPALPTSGLIKGRKIIREISKYIGEETQFSDLEIPFACVATDIDNGEEIVINTGLVTDALRASISMPGIFTVVDRDGRHLVDGGLTTPVPVDVVRNMGADFIIAVNVNVIILDRRVRKQVDDDHALKKPNVFQVLSQSSLIASHLIAQGSLKHADIVIEPEVGHIGIGDFNRAKEFIELGREAARRAVPEIKSKLAEIQPSAFSG